MFNRRLSIEHGLPRHKTDTRQVRTDEIIFEQRDIDELKETFGADFDLYNELKG